MKVSFKRFFLLLACLLALALCAQAEQFTAEFSYARHFAPNTVAWLYQPDTTINHPVVLTGDDSFYLSNRYDRVPHKNGAIHMLRGENEDLSAPIITLHGVNCMDMTMFGSLSEYRTDGYYEAHPCMYLITPDGGWRLDIFAGIRVHSSVSEGWTVTAEDRMDKLPVILENSFLTPDPCVIPQAEDDWAVLVAQPKDKGSCYFLYARRAALDEQDIPAIYMNQLGPAEQSSVSSYATAEGVGTWLVYGQNDPLWRRMIFEAPRSPKNRPFGDGGCGPTAIAIALANLLPAEQLPVINQYAAEEEGYVFCPCGISRRHCDVDHDLYTLTTPEDFVRYMPLAVADFAMGNNIFGSKGRGSGYGTNMNYLQDICSVYGVTVTRTERAQDALDFLREGRGMALTCASGTYTPFTKTSHFLVLAAATDEHVYVLDPLRRDSYAATDPSGIIEIVETGLVRVRIEDLPACHFAPVYLLSAPQM